MDGPLSRYMESTAPQPTQASLDALLAKVARVRVFDGGLNWDRPYGATVLAEVDDAAGIEELRKALRIVDGAGGHCMCDGEPTLELLAADGRRVATIGLHHGLAIRWSGWKDDARLLEGMELLVWLAGNGVDEPLQQFLEDQGESAAAEAAWNHWLEGMPECLRKLPEASWQKVLEKGDIFPLLAALAKAYPDARERALALFAWHGHGGPAWSGFPEYEMLPAAVLAQYPPGELAKIAEAAELGQWQVDGAARFFACHDPASPARLPDALGPTGMVVSTPGRRGGVLPLSPRLRATLLEAAAMSVDDDSLERAEAAFLAPADREFLAAARAAPAAGRLALLPGATPFRDAVAPQALAAWTRAMEAAVAAAFGGAPRSLEVMVRCRARASGAPEVQLGTRGEATDELRGNIGRAVYGVAPLGAAKGEILALLVYPPEA